MIIEYRYSNQKHELWRFSKMYEEKAVIILMEWIKIYLFCKKDESEVIVFYSV